MTSRRSSRKPKKTKLRRGRALGRAGVPPLRRSEPAALGRPPRAFICRFRGPAFLAMAGSSSCWRETEPSTSEIGVFVAVQDRLSMIRTRTDTIDHKPE